MSRMRALSTGLVDRGLSALDRPPEASAWLQLVTVTLNSGRPSGFKIECDELSLDEILAAASLLTQLLPPFRWVSGVPTGGTRLAHAMRAFTGMSGPLLIVDDVWTTGGSMEDHRAGREALGAVLFARGPVAPWVTPLFTLNDGLWQA